MVSFMYLLKKAVFIRLKIKYREVDLTLFKHAQILVATVIIFAITGLVCIDLSLAASTTFSDLQGHWAQKAVSRAAALDFISGYPDGKFRPEQEISQIEALVLFMRADGINLSDASSQTKTGKNISSKIKTPTISWGQSYLDKAAEDHFLSTEEVASFNPDASATRAQVAELITRILQLSISDQPSASSEKAIFSDLVSCSPAYLPYIKSISDAKIMTGFQDGTFGPNLGIKRSEAAALLSNMIEQRWAKVPDDRFLSGWIKQINQQNNTTEIELVSLQGTQKVKLDPDIQCYYGEQEYQPFEAVDCEAEVLLNSKKQAAFISLLDRHKNSTPDEQITGTVKSVALGKDSLLVISDLVCQERCLLLSWDAEIDASVKGGKVKGFQSLKPLTFIKAFLTDGKVTKVTLLETKNVSGVVGGLTDHRLSLSGKTTKNGIPEWFNYWDRARIVDKDGVRAGNVARGDTVKITYLDPIPEGIDDEIPLEIMITSESVLKKVTGVVQSPSGSARMDQIILSKDKSYDIDSTATIYLSNGTETTFSAIQIGDKVEMEVDGAGVVMKVTIK